MPQVLQSLNFGDHVALAYSTTEEQMAWATEFIRLGLERGERCLYIAHENPVDFIRKCLQGAEIDVASAEERKDLFILTKDETYLRHGVFEPEKTLEDLQEWIRGSLSAGYAGFRATGEMSWALDLPSSLERLLEYAAGLEARSDYRFIGMCQFDETRFPESSLEDILSVHSKVIRRGELVIRGPRMDRYVR